LQQLEDGPATPFPECPQCHMPTANSMGKTYCPQCGWNREEADRQTRLFLRILPVLVIIFDSPLVIWVFVGQANMPVLALLGILSTVPAILVVLVMKNKIRFRSFGLKKN
jgi:hypothetical protein